jgi:putative RecB family exonuclease
MVIKMPAMEEDELHLSASSCKTLIEYCPRKFYYRYFLNLKPQDKASALVYGSGIHDALALYYLTLKQSKRFVPATELIKVAHGYMDKAEDVLYKRGETLATLKASATKLLEAFSENGYKPKGEILAVEQKFSIAVPGIPEKLVGYFDLVTREGSKIVVTDHKTAAKFTDKSRSADIQMSLYSHSAKKIFGVESVELQFQDLIKTKVPKIVLQKLPIQDEAKALELLLSGSAIIEAAVQVDKPELLLPPRISWMCGSCCYRRVCRS